MDAIDETLNNGDQLDPNMTYDGGLNITKLIRSRAGGLQTIKTAEWFSLKPLNAVKMEFEAEN